MSTITVVNRHTHAAQPGDIYIGRGTPFGNPFIVGKDGARGECVGLFLKAADDFHETNEPGRMHPDYWKAVLALKARYDAGEALTLVCSCKPNACHGDIIKATLEDNLDHIRYPHLGPAVPPICFRSPREIPYGILHNWAEGFPIKFDERVWPTSEHLYQAGKFPKHRQPIIEAIRAAPTPREAKAIANANKQHWYPNWDDIKVGTMLKVVGLKVAQHSRVATLLAHTKGFPLVETSRFDDYWGMVEDQGKFVGLNRLGEILMSIRDLTPLPERHTLHSYPLPQTAPKAPYFAVCRIMSPTQGERTYGRHQLAQAFADIQRARERRPTLTIGVVGSRDLSLLIEPNETDPAKQDVDREHIALHTIHAAVLALCAQRDLPLSAVVIVSGAAKGIDTMARRYAVWQGLPLIEFPADWQRHGPGTTDRQAGFVRNQFIVDVADEILAWPRRNVLDQPDGGTQDTITKARHDHKPVTCLYQATRARQTA